MHSCLRVEDIGKDYWVANQKNPILKNINFTLNEGELVAIVGASGSGKSTLMHILGLLDKQDQGEYYLYGERTQHLNTNRLATLRNQTIGFVFQQFYLLPRLTVEQNVGLPLQYRPIDIESRQALIEQALKRVNMHAFLARKPVQLSGGQQQRVAIARALVGKPAIILADEPTGSLDSRTGQEIMELFLTLHRDKHTIAIITHDEKIAAQCQRRLHLKDGQLVEDVNV